MGNAAGQNQRNSQKKLTKPTDIKTHHVAASKQSPEYLVESGKSGKPAAHKAESLKKK